MDSKIALRSPPSRSIWPTGRRSDPWNCWWQQLNAIWTFHKLLFGRIAHAVKRAEQEASKGHLRWIQHRAPNVDPNIVQNVYKSIGETEGAKRAVDDAVKAEAARASEAEAKAKGGPKAYAPRPPPPKVMPTSAPGHSSSSSSAAPGPAKAKPAYKQLPTTARSTRPSPGDRPQQAPQYKKKRTD